MTEQNPPAGVPSYPQAPPTARGFAPNGQQYAPWHLRVVAYIIDGIPPIIFFLPLLFGINWGALNSGTTTTLSNGTTITTMNEPPFNAFFWVWYFVGFLLVLAWLFWNTCYRQSKTGKSIGKSAMKITTVDSNTGQYKGFWWLFLRQWLLGFDFAICYVGVLWPLWDDRRQCLISDKATSAVVLKDAK